MSRYETHSYKTSLNEKNAMDEMEISENGPFEFRAGKLLIVKMDKYWRKETKSDTFDILDTFSSRKKWKNFTKNS